LKKFAISDIHGCNRTFNEVLQKTGLNKDDQLFLLGDYIDRGPDSKGVIDTIFNLQNEGYQVHCLRGNHEQMLMDAWQKNDFHYTRRWLMHGGA
jgi:serine/threonine protein phosphatase 1